MGFFSFRQEIAMDLGTANTGGHGLEVSGSGNSTINFTASKTWAGSTSSNGNHTHIVTVSNTGSGQAVNHMPPYIALYIWERVS